MAIIPNAQKFHTVSSTVDTTDRGSSELQSQREIYTMQDIKDSTGLGYKIYAAILNQTGTNAPVPTVLQNDFAGTTFTWVRNAGGNYSLIGTVVNPWVLNKTAIIVNGGNASSTDNIRYEVLDTQVIDFRTGSVDGRFVNGFVEIRVYN
tara:strand:- start:51 stop:497 length:447 start_codon:yes stop_codon:yes gene_type:complete